MVGADPGGGDEDGVGVVGVEAVEADQGVEVHGAAGLELGDLGVAQPQLDVGGASPAP